MTKLSNEYIHANFNHTKPADLKRKEKKVEKEYNVRDHTFFGEEHITKPLKFMDEMIKGHRVCELGPFYYNQIDYTKLPEG